MLSGLSIDRQTGEVLWSFGLTRLLGERPGSRLTLTGLTRYVHPEDVSQVIDAIRQAAKTMQLAMRCRIRPGDGGTRHVDVFGEPEDRATDRFAVIFRDVEATDESLDRLTLIETAISMLDEMIIITEADVIDPPHGPRIVYVNDAVERITGFRPDETIGRTPRIFQGSDTDRTALDSIRQALERRSHVTAELVNYRKDGTPLVIEIAVSPVYDNEGELTHFAAVQRDMTERVAAQRELAEIQERYRLFVQGTKDIVWDLDLSDGRVWCSENTLGLLGTRPTTRDEWLDRIHPEDRQRVRAFQNAILEGAGDERIEQYRLQREDGSYLDVEDRGIAVQERSNRPARLVGVVRDITLVKEMDEQLRRKQRLEALGSLTGGVAHDFNNLLTIILGNADLLEEQLSGTSQGQRAATIVGAAERGQELTGRMLAFARAETLRPISVDLVELVEDVRPILESALDPRYSLDVVVQPELKLAHVDPGKLEIALLNLVVNARDAMQGGGAIVIRLENDGKAFNTGPEDERRHGAEFVAVSVSDSGSGMSPDVAQHAFDPFFTTKGTAGTGLGLSMVYGFAKQSGGHVELATEPGQGTTVRIFLPTGRPTSGSRETVAAPPTLREGRHVLLVEDDPEVRSYAAECLRSFGMEVSVAASAEDALTISDDLKSIDLLLTDLILPGLDGRTLAERLRRVWPDLRVLFTTGHASSDIMPPSMASGETHLLRKPYRRRDLATRVQAALDGRAGLP